MNPACQTYCWGANRVEWVQYGWWPGNVCCTQCRLIWEAKCRENPGCVSNARWMRYSEALFLQTVIEHFEQNRVR